MKQTQQTVTQWGLFPWPAPSPTPTSPTVAQADTPNAPIWAALIGAIGAVIVAFISKTRSNKPAPSPVIDGLEGMVEMDDLLSAFSACGVDRAILFEGKNGGAMPRKGRAWKVCATQYWVSPGIDDSIIATYNHLNVDSAYRKMLVTAAKSERQLYDFFTEKEDDCQLQRYYAMEAVTHSIIVILGEKDDSLFFMSAARHGGQYTPGEITKIEQLAHQVRIAVLPQKGK